jgi:hypothetical protein
MKMPLAAGRVVVLIVQIDHIEAAGGMDHRGIGGVMRLGAALPIAGNRAIDQPGIELGQRGIIQPEAGHHAGAEVLDHNVEAGHQLLDQISDRRGLEVAGQRRLPALRWPK